MARWLARRLCPVLATAGLIGVGMASTVWWGPGLAGHVRWSLPDDLWGTLIAAQRLAHLDLAGLYARPTELVGLPGAAVILVPVAALISTAGLSLQLPGAHGPNPAAWLVAGPYEIALSSVALFAADSLAERLGASQAQRVALAGASAVALWNVSVRWGHPEDAVAVGLLLFAAAALAQGRPGRAGWLAGAAVAVQPLVLLALPVLAAAMPARRVPGFLARAAVPAAVLLAAAAAANWTATVSAVIQQPNWPSVDHPTPWTSLAPHLAHGTVAGGPGRVLAVAAACGCALAARWRWRTSPEGRWTPELLAQVLWWMALTLALRSLFESVMVAYYLWPVLAVALIAAVRDWARLAATAAAAAALTIAAQASWRSPWAWWLPMVAGLGVTLFLARLPRPARPPRPAPG